MKTWVDRTVRYLPLFALLMTGCVDSQRNVDPTIMLARPAISYQVRDRMINVECLCDYDSTGSCLLVPSQGSTRWRTEVNFRVAVTVGSLDDDVSLRQLPRVRRLRHAGVLNAA